MEIISLNTSLFFYEEDEFFYMSDIDSVHLEMRPNNGSRVSVLLSGNSNLTNTLE